MTALIHDDEAFVFDAYFAGIVSMAHCHPGTTRDAGLNLSLDACAKKALEMVEIRRSIMAGDPKWLG